MHLTQFENMKLKKKSKKISDELKVWRKIVDYETKHNKEAWEIARKYPLTHGIGIPRAICIPPKPSPVK